MNHLVILFHSKNLDNIHSIVFATRQQELVAKMLLDFFKEHENKLSKTEMAFFATLLEKGAIVLKVEETFSAKKMIKLSYNKKQFYDRILTPMKEMGMVEYDNNQKVYQLSDAFSTILQEIGNIWSREIRKPAELMITA